VTNCPNARSPPLAPQVQHVVAPAQVCSSSLFPTLFRPLIECRFNQKALIDTTPLPDDIPKVQELGASSAPLLSASFFIGARCKDYNDDYMMCKTESGGRGELECMKEGRKVTRCAASVYGTWSLVARRMLTIVTASRTSTRTVSLSSGPTGSAWRTTISNSGTAGQKSGG
jgi:hypothetical protein